MQIYLKMTWWVRSKWVKNVDRQFPKEESLVAKWKLIRAWSKSLASGRSMRIFIWELVCFLVFFLFVFIWQIWYLIKYNECKESVKNDAEVTSLGDRVNSRVINCHWECRWRGSNKFDFGCVACEVPLGHPGKCIW